MTNVAHSGSPVLMFAPLCVTFMLGCSPRCAPRLPFPKGTRPRYSGNHGGPHGVDGLLRNDKRGVQRQTIHRNKSQNLAAFFFKKTAHSIYNFFLDKFNLKML